MKMELNKMIDHTLLKSDAQKEQIEQLCKEAIEYQFYSVCVNSSWVKCCKEQLANSDVCVCSVVGFPLGAMHPDIMALEAKQAVLDGASEIDMVIPIGLLKDQAYDEVYTCIQKVVEASVPAQVKVILETCLLTKEEIQKACEIALKAKAHFVKTSTGFASGGAKKEDVLLMKQCVREQAKVKASGGIRTLVDAMTMLHAGADRLGCSASVNIMKEFKKNKENA